PPPPPPPPPPPRGLRPVLRKKNHGSAQPLNGQGSVEHVLAHPLFGGHGKPSRPCVALQHTALRQTPRQRHAFFVFKHPHHREVFMKLIIAGSRTFTDYQRLCQ